MDTTIVVILVLALLIGLAISASSISKIIRIRRTPTTWISALPSAGRVEVSGKVGEKTILSPVLKTACAAYKFEIAELRKSNKGSSWSTIRKMQSEEPFEINDDTGSILVRPSGADFILNPDCETDTLVPDQIAAIASMGVKTTGFFGSQKTLKVKEFVIRPQQEIYVMGQIQPENGQKTVARSADCPLVISDRSERDVLRTLYKRVGLNLLISIGVGAAIIIAFVTQ